MLLARWLLPKRKARADEADYLRLDRYYTELVIEEDSRWIGKPMAEFNRYYDGRLEVAEWLRNGVRQHDKGKASCWPWATYCSRARLRTRSRRWRATRAVACTPSRSTGARAARRTRARTSWCRWWSRRTRRSSARPSAASTSASRSTSLVVGLWRREEWIRDKLSQVKMREGDLLVLRGTPERFAELASHHGFLMMVPFSANPRRRAVRHAHDPDRCRHGRRGRFRRVCRRRSRSWEARSRWC